MTRYGKIGWMAAASMAMTPAIAVAQADCDAKVAALSTLTTDYQDEQAALQTEGEGIEKAGSNISIAATFDMKMKEQRWIFHLPTTAMKLRAMALDLPQTTMKTRSISWDNLTIVMRPTKTGQYPTFKCHGFKCTVKWKDIIIDVPHTEMRPMKVSMDVPEFTMKRTDFSTKIPEFSMKKQEWVMKVPEFKLRDIKAEGQALEKRGTQLGEKADALAGTIKTDAAQRSAAVYACYRTDLNDKRQQVATQFDGALAQIDTAIVSIRAAGADPAAMQTDDGVLNLVAQRLQLEKERSDALKQIDDALKTMDDQQVAVTTDVIA